MGMDVDCTLVVAIRFKGRSHFFDETKTKRFECRVGHPVEEGMLYCPKDGLRVQEVRESVPKTFFAELARERGVEPEDLYEGLRGCYTKNELGLYLLGGGVCGIGLKVGEGPQFRGGGAGPFATSLGRLQELAERVKKEAAIYHVEGEVEIFQVMDVY